jgi:malonyl-CoA/methylmalonyl-CoA synthetase
MNYFAAIETVLAADPQAELITTVDGECLTRSDIAGRTAQMANALHALGAHPGDRISVQVDKSIGNLCLFLACLQGGFVFHPLNPAYQRGEVEYFLGNAEPAAIICDPAKTGMMGELASTLGIAQVLEMDGRGRGSFADLADGQDDSFKTVPRTDDNMAALLYSSGTTGRPKGIMLTHDNLRSNAQTLVEAWGFTPADRLFHCLPMFHVHGLFVALGCVLLSGARMRWANAFSSDLAKAHLPDCTVMMGVPTYYTRLLGDEDFGREQCAGMRLFVSGSAPLLAETFAAFRARTGHTILERYGMTETGMNTSNPLNGERRPGTVGPPLPGVEVRVVNDDGTPTPDGEVGNLQVRGANVFKAYWRMPEKTAEDFREGRWFDTGDQATLSLDGYVSIVGRSKDMVITGGLNVYPKEIEDVIDGYDGVLESAVIGVPHPDFGEAVVAVIVPQPGNRPDPETIIARAKQDLSNFKVPKRVHLMDALPRNTMGKVQKKALREHLADSFG